MQESDATALTADLAIVGGGPAGATLALLTARHGFNTILVDARDPDATGRRDPRNYAIVRGSWRLLGAAGVAETLQPHAQPLNGLEAVDGAPHWFGAPSVLFSNEDLSGEEPLGYMIEAARLQEALDQAVNETPGLVRLAPALFDTLEQTPGHASLVLRDGRKIKANLIAGCDGANSRLRKRNDCPDPDDL